jgi:peptide/nickel transport system permease protein
LPVSLLTFLIASLLPGDLAYVILGDQATPEKVEALRHDMGLDQPIWWRYLGWLGHVLQGDFGRSFRTGQTVLQAVAERLPVSFELMVLAEIIGLAIGVPLAIACAVRSGSAFDRFMTGSAFAMLSVPTFLSAILLIYLFAVELRWFPATGYVPFREDPLGNLRFFVLPALTLALPNGRDHARASFRHDRDPAGRLYRDGQGQGIEAVAHPVRARPETLIADAVTITGSTSGD